MEARLIKTMNNCLEMLGINETLQKEFNHILNKLPVMDFRPFYTLVCLYRNGKISRERFELEWKLRQKEGGNNE